MIGSLATLVFVFGALTQLLMGRLVDRYTLPRIVVGLSVLQPLGLGHAALTSGIPMLAGLILAVAAIYGQVVVNDAMVARYVPAQFRAGPSVSATSLGSRRAVWPCHSSRSYTG